MTEYVELKTFKRINDEKIVLDGIIWTTDIDKMIEIKNVETGGILQSIVVLDTYYYPMAIDTKSKKQK